MKREFNIQDKAAARVHASSNVYVFATMSMRMRCMR